MKTKKITKAATTEKPASKRPTQKTETAVSAVKKEAVPKPVLKVVKTKSAAPAKTPKKPEKRATVDTKATRAPAPIPPLPSVTTIEAFIDVGFGNRLTLRGEGAAGLSWERGLTMDCLGSAEWVLSVEGGTLPLSFKFLLNDEQWSLGENYTLTPGKTGAFTPEF